ncbi:hypothetical protein [Amycolatopsis sp. CA-230715]|uniref:hypothetical protein n=1 Tax=Amycolatopsis sp. CA-230715 TaxID=2745196 RepID=UPI001C01FA90|nr:hypothetical protein [Amycolatopsis sp. CA-230715]QWF77862.1 hypothetical protein HUW46_01255 [Amycolatopsis sp. CA-230715]
MEGARSLVDSPLSRRRMLGLSAAALGLTAAGCSVTGAGAAQRVVAPPPAGVLAANFNQSLDAIDFAALAAVSATWLRGFYLMQNADRGEVADQPGMRKLTDAIGQGYGTVLSLKFAYDNGLPAPGSGAMATALARMDKVLAVVMGKVDILVIGNEPFYECGGKTANLNEFYEALAQHAIDYRREHAGTGKQTQIYLGALTRLENPRNDWLPHLDRWLDFARGNHDIAGTDCHPHVAAVGDCRKYLDRILPRLRQDQKFLATEFSLVKLWAKHFRDPVSARFADEYHVPKDTPVWQVARDAAEHPVPQAEWNDFLLSQPWFADQKRCMAEMMAMFREHDRCAVAAYGITQDTGATHHIGPDKKPWLFNSIFCPYTVQRGHDGLPGQNTTWRDEFRALQHL